MDYWGYGPFHNCDAINFINRFRFPFPISFSRIAHLYYRTSNPEEERVVIQLYLNSSHCEDKFTDKCIEHLNRILENNEWIDKWASKQMIIDSIKKQISQLEQKSNSYDIFVK